jgi:nucleoid-associated protein YgaU
MSINADSRYTTATITTAVGPDGGTRQEMRVAQPRSRVITYTYHRVVDGERVDTIAKDFYGKAELWWMIADSNPEVLDWLDLEPGTILRVPSA